MAIMQALAGFSRILSGIILVAIVAVTSVAIFYRYFLGTPIIATEELSRVLLILMAYCSSLALPHLREHMAIEFGYDLMPASVQWVFDAVHYIVGTGFLGLLAFSGYQLALSMSGIRLPALQFPVSYVFGVVAVACGLHAVIYAIETVRFLAAGRRTEVAGDRETAP